MMESEFTQRASQITPHGLGLSVDVYSPDVILLAQRLHNEGLQPGYMEIFKATTSALQWVRRRLPALKLTYHGEGLWVTQPEFLQNGSGRQGLAEACAHIAALGSAWLNHECATKHMAGYAFGTYLPPLYTALSASMTAENLVYVQGQLDEQARRYETSHTGFAGNAAADVFRLRCSRDSAVGSPDVGDVDALVAPRRDELGHDRGRLVGRVVEDLDLEAIGGVVHPRHVVDQPVRHVDLVVDRELDGDRRPRRRHLHARAVDPASVTTRTSGR